MYVYIRGRRLFFFAPTHRFKIAMGLAQLHEDWPLRATLSHETAEGPNQWDVHGFITHAHLIGQKF